MTTLMRGARGAVLAAATLAATGCSQLGTLGNVLGGVMNPNGGSSGSEVYGEVQYVDTQRQQIQVRTQQGQTGSVYFDSRTRVVYQQQEYPVTALERGDEVGMRVQQTQQGAPYTDYIVVTRSVQERGGGVSSSALQQAEGRVGWVDANRGQFQLLTSRNVIVALPYNSRSTDVSRFRSLRQGDYVRVEGRLVSQDRLELERFL